MYKLIGFLPLRVCEQLGKDKENSSRKPGSQPREQATADTYYTVTSNAHARSTKIRGNRTYTYRVRRVKRWGGNVSMASNNVQVEF